jgi:hypothetical protein
VFATTTSAVTAFVGGRTDRADCGGIWSVVVVAGIVVVVEVVVEEVLVVVPAPAGIVVEVVEVVVACSGRVVAVVVVVVVGFGTPLICTGLGRTEIATNFSAERRTSASFARSVRTRFEQPPDPSVGAYVTHSRNR